MMFNYCVKRFASMLLVLWGISVLSFLLGIMSPGDPAEFVLNQDGLNDPTDEQIAQMRSQMGLDRPVWVQYLNWLCSVLQGNLGESYISGKNIAVEIWHRLPVTVECAVLALVIAGIGGILLGTACAVKKDSIFDNCCRFLTNGMLAIPGFWLALILILIFSETLRLLPTSGNDGFSNFIMPAVVLSFSTMATVCQFMRNALLNEFSKQYMIVAKVRGIDKLKLLLCYALPNACIPVIALLGNYFASVLGGSVIVESIFALPGISSMALEAIRYRDYPVLQAYVLVSGTILVFVMMAVDILIAYLDPKIKLEGKR